jgi:hypothetical protein
LLALLRCGGVLPCCARRLAYCRSFANKSARLSFTFSQSAQRARQGATERVKRNATIALVHVDPPLCSIRELRCSAPECRVFKQTCGVRALVGNSASTKKERKPRRLSASEQRATSQYRTSMSRLWCGYAPRGHQRVPWLPFSRSPQHRSRHAGRRAPTVTSRTKTIRGRVVVGERSRKPLTHGSDFQGSDASSDWDNLGHPHEQRHGPAIRPGSVGQDRA